MTEDEEDLLRKTDPPRWVRTSLMLLVDEHCRDLLTDRAVSRLSEQEEVETCVARNAMAFVLGLPSKSARELRAFIAPPWARVPGCGLGGGPLPPSRGTRATKPASDPA